MDLKEILKKIQDGLRSGDFSNEAAVSQGIVLQVFHALGWPVFNARIVWPQYTVEGRRVDYALCHPEEKPVAFIEVKAVGGAEGADKQLFEYTYREGVPMAVLTDGREWHFYLPAEQGRYEERRVYTLNLLERHVDESAERLTRYLSYDNIRSGKALNAAREDYRNVARRREVERVLPVAWERLIREKDELLVDLVADKVASICGYKPEQNAVVDFLNGLSSRDIGQKTPSPPHLRGGKREIPRSNAPRMAKGSFGFVLNGREVECRNGKDVLIKIIEELSANDKNFLERFDAIEKHGTRRRYIARRREDINPGRPDIAEKLSHRLKSGWWISTNNSFHAIKMILKMACDVAGLSFGRDLIVHLGD